jgi:hypothetical protein
LGSGAAESLRLKIATGAFAACLIEAARERDVCGGAERGRERARRYSADAGEMAFNHLDGRCACVGVYWRALEKVILDRDVLMVILHVSGGFR